MAADGASACFDLAAACCRCPAGAARDEAVALAARAVTDWTLALRIIGRHRIEGLAYAALTAAPAALPEDVLATLRRRGQDIAQDNLAAAAEGARLQALLDSAGIRSLHLKGMALAQLAYGSMALKYSQDIDLLVSPSNAVAAIRLLESDGYRLMRPAPPLDARQLALVLRYGRGVALRHLASGRQVELRWQAVRSPALLRGVGADLPSQDVALSDATRLRTLNDGDLFAYLCVHGAGHGWSRLQWLADLNAWMARRDEATLVRCYRHAEAIGAGTCAALALSLCRRVLGRVLPAIIAPEIERNTAARWAAALALTVMTRAETAATRREARFVSTRVAVMQFLLATAPRHYADVARDLSFRIDDVVALPLPAALHVVYPLARLPLWLWRKAALAPKRRPRSGVGSA